MVQSTLCLIMAKYWLVPGHPWAEWCSGFESDAYCSITTWRPIISLLSYVADHNLKCPIVLHTCQRHPLIFSQNLLRPDKMATLPNAFPWMKVLLQNSLKCNPNDHVAWSVASLDLNQWWPNSLWHIWVVNSSSLLALYVENPWGFK